MFDRQTPAPWAGPASARAGERSAGGAGANAGNGHLAPDQRWGAERLVQIGRLLLLSTETDEVLHNVARGMCEVSGYDRSVIVEYDQERDVITGRAGWGVPAEFVPLVREPAANVPVFAQVQAGRDPVVVPAEQVRSAIPERYVDLFQATGTLVVMPLYSDELGLLGAAFVDRAARQFWPQPAELRVLRDFADLAALAFQNALLMQQSMQLAAVLERGRIAADLHDGVIQQLYAVSLDLEELLAAPELPRSARDVLQRIAERVASGSRQLRAALFELAQEPPENTGGRILDEIHVAIRDFARSCDIGIDLETYGDGLEPTGQARRLVVRLVREGLANVRKHSGATQAVVVLRRGRTWWTVEVMDDGSGDPREIRRQASCPCGHFGLASLRREADRIGGRLWVSQAPLLGGIRLSVAVPSGANRQP